MATSGGKIDNDQLADTRQVGPLGQQRVEFHALSDLLTNRMVTAQITGAGQHQIAHAGETTVDAVGPVEWIVAHRPQRLVEVGEDIEDVVELDAVLQQLRDRRPAAQLTDQAGSPSLSRGTGSAASASDAGSTTSSSATPMVMATSATLKVGQ